MEAMKYICVYSIEIRDSFADFTYAGVNSSGGLVEEPWDHGLQEVGMTKSIWITSQEDDYGELDELHDDIAASVFVTDSRVAFYSENYDTGGSFLKSGGDAIGLILVGISKARAKKRSEGKVMVGHIRYEWLEQVAFHSKASWADDDSLILHYTDSDGLKWEALFSFPKETNIRQIANLILQKAAKYKLAMSDEKSAKERELLSTYTQGREIEESTWDGSSLSDKIARAALISESEKMAVFPAPEGEAYRPEV
jgi:hypothetical protein